MDTFEPIRPKRPNRSLLGYWLKLYVPLPVRLKCDVQQVCRERRMSQAELGLRIVQAAFEDAAWLGHVLDRARDTADAERSEASTAVGGVADEGRRVDEAA